MYDFYTNPPKTKQDLREWLTSWLEKPAADHKELFEIKGEPFIQEYGFRRAFYLHCVFRNTKTNEWVWWVYPDTGANIDEFTKERFTTYEALLEHVIQEYSILWKLKE